MRRIALAAVAVLAVAWTAPAAAASPNAHLTLAGPDAWDAPDGRATVPLVVALVLEDFVCSGPARFPVEIAATAHGALADNATAWVDVPAGSYMGEAFVAEVNATVNVTDAEPEAVLVLNATFASSGEPCFAPGGFPEAHDGLEVLLRGPPPAEPEPAPEANETENATEDEPPAPQPPDANETEPGADEGDGALSPRYRYVGDDAEVVEESRDTPGPGALLGGAAVAATALAARRRLR